ncbi:MAG: hypothetical protein HKN16_13425, partial [Saprospiraceae bacterium]|nr:hypothetical protein [Saprospiraceae bacterium]
NNGVQDPGERGIPNVTVNLLTDADQDGVYTASGTSTVTNEYGHYIFDDLVPGAYTVEVVETGISSAGFTTTPTGDPDSDGDNISKPVLIAPGDVWLGGDFGYNNAANPADVGSVIFVDVDGSGDYLFGTDLPLAGVTVALIKETTVDGTWDPAAEEVVATTTTDVNGAYLFPDLPDGDYIVVVTDSDNIINDLSNTVDPDAGNDGYSAVNVAVADKLAENFGYVPTGHIAGKGFIGDHVFYDMDANNAFTAGEAGIEGVEVELRDAVSDAILSTTNTNENGMYFFGNLDDGDYKVTINTATVPTGLENSIDPNGSAPGDNEGGTVSITSGSSDLTQDFGYKATTPLAISGTLWEDSNADGVKDGTETMYFANVPVVLRSADGNILATTITNATGDYSFPNLPDGFNGTVEVPDTPIWGTDFYWHSLGTDSEPTISSQTLAGSSITGVDFGYYSRGAAIGNLVWNDIDKNGSQDAAENGIQDAVLELKIDFDGDLTDDLSIFTKSDTDGFFSFGNLLLDEHTNGDGIGSEPTFTLAVSSPTRHSKSTANATGVDAKQNSDTHAGVTAIVVQGQTDVSSNTDPMMETVQASYDFGFYALNSILPIDDDEGTLINIPVPGNILTNDLDPELDGITLSGFEDPLNPGSFIGTGTVSSVPGEDGNGNPVANAGDITIGPNGDYTYTPALDFTGMIFIPYQICDDFSTSACEKAILRINVCGIPDPTDPNNNETVANNDDNVTPVNIPVSGGVMDNDMDPTLENQSFTGFEDPASPGTYVNSGTLSSLPGTDDDGNSVSDAGSILFTPDGSYTYSPSTDFTGVIFLDYEICDDNPIQACANAVLRIDVIGDEDPSDNNKPFAGDDFSVTPINTPVVGSFVQNDHDPNGNVVRVDDVLIDPSEPSPTSIGTFQTEKMGDITLYNDGSYEYMPPVDYYGPDSYIYGLCDSSLLAPQPLCDSATIKLIVIPIYRDFSDHDNGVYAPAYNWCAPDLDLDFVPDSSEAFWLGERIDYEIADFSSAMADGDDSNGSGESDEDGLVFPNSVTPGQVSNFSVTVNSNKSGLEVFFGLWIDWDGGGFDSLYTGSGITSSPTTVSVPVTIPAGYAGANIYTRLRAFNAPPVSGDFAGGRANGEVEDRLFSLILPVDLKSFQASARGCKSLLSWETASEENFSHFEIQRSENGKTYHAIAEIAAAGGSNSRSYNYMDHFATPVCYYRLKMMDVDGTFEYSEVINIRTECADADDFGITLYPNPVAEGSDHLTARFYTSRPETKIFLSNSLGKTAKVFELETRLGWNTEQFDISDLPEGTYYFTFRPYTKMKSQRFVIIRR